MPERVEVLLSGLRETIRQGGTPSAEQLSKLRQDILSQPMTPQERDRLQGFLDQNEEAIRSRVTADVHTELDNLRNVVGMPRPPRPERPVTRAPEYVRPANQRQNLNFDPGLRNPVASNLFGVAAVTTILLYLATFLKHPITNTKKLITRGAILGGLGLGAFFGIPAAVEAFNRRRDTLSKRQQEQVKNVNEERELSRAAVQRILNEVPEGTVIDFNNPLLSGATPGSAPNILEIGNRPITLDGREIRFERVGGGAYEFVINGRRFRATSNVSFTIPGSSLPGMSAIAGPSTAEVNLGEVMTSAQRCRINNREMLRVTADLRRRTGGGNLTAQGAIKAMAMRGPQFIYIDEAALRTAMEQASTIPAGVNQSRQVNLEYYTGNPTNLRRGTEQVTFTSQQ